MDKKNLYNEENSFDEDEEEEVEDSEELDDNEDATESLVDFADMVIASENNTGINFYKQNEINDNTTGKQIAIKQVENSNPIKNEEIQSNEDDFVQNLDNSQTNENYQSPTNDKFVEDQIKDKLDLLDLDLESMPKDDLINLLLRADETPQEKKFDKKKINSKLNPRNHRSEIKMNSVYSNMQQMYENKDPELSQDFNVALTKILAKMVKESNNQNQEVFDILLSDKDKVAEELNKYEFSKKTKIDEKIRYWLEKKNKSLEIIQEKINEDFQKVHTFSPNMITNNKNSIMKRNFGQFLEDQKNHKKKINEKIDLLREAKLKDSVNDYQSAPKINEFSKKIAEEKIKNELNNNNFSRVYDRLYNKRNLNNKKSLLKSPTKKVLQNTSKKLDERTKILYQDAVKRQVKQKERQNLKKDEKNVHKSSQTSNKYILKKFKQQYKEEVEHLLEEIIVIEKSNQREYQVLNKLNFVQLNTLLQNLHFISKDKETLEEENINQKENLNNPLSSKNQERRLMVDLYENLKDKDGFVDLDHLFIFCLSILNLLEYFVIKSFKGINPTKEEMENIQMPNSLSQKTLKNSASGTKIIKKNNSAVTINEESMQNLVHKLNLDLANRIMIPKKYGGLDEENNFIITFDHARLILKDFNLFKYNYNNNTHKNKTNKTPVVFNEEFKPKINPKSVQLSNKYRQKVINDMDNMNKNELNEADNDDNFSSPRINSKVNKVTNDYVDLMNLKKKKKEKLYEKIREEKQLKELENCTFKPKINNTYQFRENVVPVDNQTLQRDQRIDQMYKRGTEALINKKNKTKDDFDVEKHGKECTFKPNINDRDVDILFDKENSKINYDKDILKFNERMKRGRIEKEIRENALRRGEEFTSPQKYETKRIKSETKISSGNKKQINSNSSKLSETNEFNKKYQEYINQHLNHSNNYYTNTSNSETIVKHERNSIPLLIIDVNIRPGEKKKITVFEGDTAERLAANFASEHNLDYSTRNKLEALIQSQLSRLLSKIEEENQSIKSEKSNGF